MKILQQEKISAYSHGIVVPFALIGTLLLTWKSQSNAFIMASTIVYGFSAAFLFAASFLYHAHKRKENEDSIWRKLDHIAIYVLIAGTYTALCALFLSGTMQTAILLAQWGLVFSGVFLSLFWLSAPRFLSTSIYVLMGWVVLIPIKTLKETMPPEVFFCLFGGGALYTIGAVIYAIKKPNFKSTGIGFHEIFHFFIVGGAVAHYMMIFLALP